VPYASNQGLHIHYEVEGEGPPLVLQHGSASSIEAWYQNGCVGSLKAHYQIILIDARGHGRSDKPRDVASYALPLRVSDVVAVLDDLGIQRTHYWGYSMGGWIGFGMAKHAASRVQSLILGGAHPYAESAEVFHDVDGTDPDAFISAMEKYVGVRVTPEVRAWILGNDLQALAAAMHDRDSFEEIVPTMTMPCFLYAGELDPRIQKIEMCAEDMPNAEFVSIYDLNHAQAYMRSGLVIPDVEKFLCGASESGLVL
jgi:pimeloyl-ACP methyl ester carboxylesterase